MTVSTRDGVLDSEIYDDIESTGYISKRLPFFALVIGINEYEKYSKLSGATADADDMDLFLRTRLNVPESHIINLRDKTATREGIIEAFRTLQNNPNIHRDDAIFVYFAGHGSEKEAPAGWLTPDSKIQVLLPQDVGMPGAMESPIPPIPDRTFSVLLNDLAESKGNNITVVLDCCHSSSGTRDDGNVPERVARVVDLLQELPENLDADFFSEEIGRSMRTPIGFLERNLRSHILLAACGAEEQAYENKRLKRGAFTTALIQTLIDTGVDKLTYLGLMDRLPNLPKQNPQCEGYHRDRMLFNAKLPGAERRFIGVENTNSTYILKAGTAHGVAVDSEFTIHAEHTGVSLANPPLCRMRATKVNPVSTILDPIENIINITIPKPAYAREVLCGSGQELRVHFSEALMRITSIPDIHRATLSIDEPDFGFIVSDADSAEMLVDIKDTSDGKRVIFSATELLATQHEYRMLPQEVETDAEDISRVLRGAARWNHHFKRTNHARFSGSIGIEFYRLDEDDHNFDEEGRPILAPVNPDENMNRTGVVDLVVKDGHFYGVKIVNNSRVDLYPYLFYFDLSDQSIEPYYLSQKGTDRVDPPLRAGSYHTVGYGAGGEVPFAFQLPPGQNLDVGFLKLFLTTRPTDFDSLTQSSPFEIGRGTLPRADIIRKLKPPSEDTEQWGTVLTAIIQRSHSRHTETTASVPSATPLTQLNALSTPTDASSFLPNASLTPPEPSLASSDAPTSSDDSLVSPKGSLTPSNSHLIPPTNAPDVSSAFPPRPPSPSNGWYSCISDCFKCPS